MFVAARGRAIIGFRYNAESACLAAVFVFGIEFCPRAVFSRLNVASGGGTASGCRFDANFNLVHHPDLVGGERMDNGPKDGDGCSNDGDIDLEDGEDVDQRCVEWHVEDGDCACPVD